VKWFFGVLKPRSVESRSPSAILRSQILSPRRYKSLKKHLKYRLLESEVNGKAEGRQSIEVEKDFLRLLHTQLKEVDRLHPPPSHGTKFWG